MRHRGPAFIAPGYSPAPCSARARKSAGGNSKPCRASPAESTPSAATSSTRPGDVNAQAVRLRENGT